MDLRRKQSARLGLRRSFRGIYVASLSRPHLDLGLRFGHLPTLLQRVYDGAHTYVRLEGSVPVIHKGK